ncbi:MAG: GNAT family N-acetyltransferase [Candidatus Omnitrophica bacterium]|nr:GNAT family N-acetyltransferase [Candidatus Omnitrophota bacterium]
MEIKIRKFKEQDQPQVQKLISTILKTEFDHAKETFTDYDLTHIKEIYSGKRDVFFVAVIGNTVIGTVAIKEDDGNTALLRRIFVSREFRGIGLGRKLIIKAVEFCEEEQFRVINFCSTDKMEAANKLCRKNGFLRRACMTLGPVKLLKFTRRLRATKR